MQNVFDQHCYSLFRRAFSIRVIIPLGSKPPWISAPLFLIPPKIPDEVV